MEKLGEKEYSTIRALGKREHFRGMAEQASLFFFVNEPRSSNRTSFTRGFDLAGYSRIMSPVFSSANPPNSILVVPPFRDTKRVFNATVCIHARLRHDRGNESVLNEKECLSLDNDHIIERSIDL